MKKEKIWKFIKAVSTPVLLVVMGILLLIRPDSASFLMARVVGWCILAAGIGCGISALVNSFGRTGKIIEALLWTALGLWLILDPMALLVGGSRLIGLALLVRGGLGLLQGYGNTWILALVGLVLMVLPMSIPRLVFLLIGAGLIVWGILMAVFRINLWRLEKWTQQEDDDPNIIDAL